MKLSTRILNALTAAAIEGGQPGFDRGFTYVEIETAERLVTISGTARDEGDSTVDYETDGGQHLGLLITSVDLNTGTHHVLHDSYTAHGIDVEADVTTAVATLRNHLS
ncbi:hypothetical protein ACFV0H_30180 [Streptomyces erythrochromogenes]|uniref:hypothetical protein n=1 Tax=Streptomyces TaxID=1883 RepID=UPI0036C8B273|nr:hypothetical protein OG489_00095 [Streptomyces erythrochromogenes]WSR88347.1 hypothetical protein OG489_39865 [Streptomyces erythrochromogenes]